MGYQQLIYDFLDGALDADSESRLMAMIASDSDIRAEFKKALAIDMSLKNDASKIGPSAKSTLGVFSALGFAAPAGIEAAAAPKESIAAKTAGGLANYSGNILTGLVVAALATAVFLSGIFEKSGPNSDLAQKQLNPPPFEKYTHPLDISSRVANSTAQANPPQGREVKIIYRYIAAPAQVSPVNSQRAISEKSEKIYLPESRLDNAPLLAGLGGLPNYSAAEEYSIGGGNQVTEVENPFEGDFINPGFSVMLKGSHSLPFVNHSPLKNRAKALSGQGITFMMPVNENWDVGVDIRNENFYQEFKGADNGRLYEYKQQPGLWSASAFAKWAIFNDVIAEDVDLYLLGALGGSSAGMISRLGLGLEIHTMRNISILLGAEFGALAYHHEGIVRTSGKYGINYGLKFRL